MKRTYLSVIAAIIFAMIILAGCQDSRTRISSILESPDSYKSREVVIGGQVDKTYAINLLIAEAGAYQVDDGTGKIWVITHNGVPVQGSRVGVKGTVSGGVKLGGEMFGAVIREKDRRTR